VQTGVITGSLMQKQGLLDRKPVLYNILQKGIAHGVELENFSRKNLQNKCRGRGGNREELQAKQELKIGMKRKGLELNV